MHLQVFFGIFNIHLSTDNRVRTACGEPSARACGCRIGTYRIVALTFSQLPKGMCRRKLHVHLVVLAGLVSLSLCDASDLYNASQTVDSLVYVPHVEHSQNLRTHSTRSIHFPVPQTPYSQRRTRLLASSAAVSALVFLIVSCFLAFAFRNTNSHGSGRSLAEKYPITCQDDENIGNVPTDSADRRALAAGQSQLACLEIPAAAFKSLEASERQLLNTAKATLLRHVGRLEALINSAAENATPQANTAVIEREQLRATLETLAWSSNQNVEALLCMAIAHSKGRRMPHSVAVALAASQRVINPKKTMTTTIAGEHQALVYNMVKSLHKEMSDSADILQSSHSLHPSVLEAARTLLDEAGPLCLQLRTVGMVATSECLERASANLKGALTQSMKRRPRRTASMPSRFATLSLSQHPQQAAQAATGAQALLQPTSSWSSLPPKGAKGAEGPHARGPHQKADALSEVPRSSTPLQRRGSEKGNTLRRSTRTAKESPTGAGVGPEAQPLDVEKTLELTSTVRQWTDKCRESLQALLSGAAREESIEKVALNGDKVYRQATSATVGSSVDSAISRALWESVNILGVSVNSLHGELVRSWSDKTDALLHRLSKARHNLQISVRELSPDSPPRAGGVYIGDLTVLRATVDAAERSLGDTSRFLGVLASHRTLAHAMGDLRSAVGKAEMELQEAIGLACRVWRRALDSELEGRPASSAQHTSSDASFTGPRVPLDSPLRACAKETAQVLLELDNKSVDAGSLLQFLERQDGNDSKRRPKGFLRTLSLRRSRSSSGSRTTSSLPKET